MHTKAIFLHPNFSRAQCRLGGLVYHPFQKIDEEGRKKSQTMKPELCRSCMVWLYQKEYLKK